MAYITTNTPHARSASFLKTVGKTLKAYAAYRKEQADYVLMMRMSNRDLKDMGVTRDDVREQMLRLGYWPGAL